MRRLFLSALITVSLTVAPLSVKAQEGSEYAEGKSLYQEKCQVCHGENGEGNGPMASAFSTPPGNFTTSEFWKDKTDEKIINEIENGHRLMPTIDVTPEQAKKIVDYMAHNFKKISP